MNSLFDRFDRVDTNLNRWLVSHSIAFLRVSLGLVFLGFGALKFFPGASPAEPLVVETTSALSFGWLTPELGLLLVATLECAIGLCFVTGRYLRVAVWLMGAQLIGAMSPLVLFPGQLFPGPMHAPTLAAQYIIKDMILIAACMVIAATWTGARIVAAPSTMRSTFRAPVPSVVRVPVSAAAGQRSGAI